ncbi:MAG TPA: ABC transporter substrate-binding protein [Firmicutes bacterium]|jgi:NitT/TauT family transport system substrate-binding protein|nr:ABC transporter substrate-binding protein [Bacillota bacterium]
MSQKTLILWSCCLLVVFSALSPANAVRPGETTVKIMALQGPTGLTLLKMIQDNPVFSPKVTASYNLLKGPDQIIAKIVSGEADIAALPTNLAAILYNKGIPIRLLAVTNWGVNYVIGRDRSIRTWTDLKGKEVAIAAPGATPDLLFRFILENNGLNPEADLKLVYYSTPVELAQLMIAGRVELGVLPEPWVSQVILRETTTQILLNFQEEWKKLHNQNRSYPQSCLVVKTAFAQTYPELISGFLREAAASSAWVTQNPDQAGILAEKHLSIQAAVGPLAIPRCNLDFLRPFEVKGEIEAFLHALYKYNPDSIGARIPDANFYQ